MNPQAKSLITCALAGFLFCITARAQTVELPFPLDPAPAPEGVDALALKPVPERIAALTNLSSVVLRNVPLPVGPMAPGARPNGTFVDLELERLHTERLRFGFHVDGRPRPDLLAGLALSIWKGTVVGDPSSEVMLSFSTHGSRGWIRTGDELIHVMPRPDESGDWTRGDVLLVTDASFARAGARFDFSCEAKRPGDGRTDSARVPRISPATSSITGGSAALGGSCNVRECKVAIEGDYQLFQVFGSLGAEMSYVTTLLSYVSDRYETQISTVLTFPYLNLWSTSNDGWDAQDSGGSCTDVLNELQATWAGNVPGGADIGHLMSGADLGCGVAWLDVLCDPQYNFSVSGNLNGNVSFPVAVSPNNWDFMVVAHEIGHNFDALHTHDYCPPLDQCPPSQYFGQCQTQQVCTNQGTIMSYCHLCSGGTNNITTFFHTTSAADMTAASQACLPAFAELDGTAPVLVAPNVATPVSAQVVGSPIGAVQLYYRPNGSSSFTATAMTPQGGGQYSASLPAAACGNTPQFYYAFTASCGLVTDPSGAPGSFYAAVVGTPNPTLADNFQTDMGWSPSNLGATSGAWQRGVPVNDGSWAYDPASDYDGSGMCWLTQNQTGNTDVDDGAVQLLSPAFSLTGGPALITYAYYLRLTDSNGTDRLLVEASSNGTSGPWVEVARHDTNGGLTWRTHAIDASDLAAAGVAQTANMRLRYTANDGNPGSIVEAGLDAFVASVLSCGGQIGTNYCAPTANSTGQPALMSATGSASVSANNLVFAAQPVPGGNGVVFYGDSQTSVPLGNGFRCVAGTLLRGPVASAVGGVLTFPFNNSIPPAVGNVVAGSTWNFQVWYRDVPAGGAQFNLSDGYQITFGP